MSTLSAMVLASTLWASVTMGQSPPAADVPPSERIILPNGLTVILAPNHTNPFVDVRWISRAGSTLDPQEKNGLASLTASMLTGGTRNRSEGEIADQLESLGARLQAKADGSSLEVAGSVVTLDPTYLSDFLDVFADVVRRANFPQEVFERTRTQRMNAVRRLGQDHGALADAVFQAAVFAGHPEANLVSGNLRTLPTLTRGDCLSFRDRVLIPAHSVLGIAGDFDRDWMIAWITEHLGDPAWGRSVCRPGSRPGFCAQLCLGKICWGNPVGARSRGGLSNDQDPGRLRVILVDRHDPSITQIHWRLGALNPMTMSDSDWGAFRIGTHALGGDFTSRLNQILRVSEGITYGVRYLVDFGAWTSGSMRTSAAVKPADLKRALDLTVQVMKQVTGGPLPTGEVDAVKSKIHNAFPFKFQTISATINQLTYLEAEGMDRAWLEGYRRRIQEPDPEDIHEALGPVRPGFTPMVLVAVGNHDLIPTLSNYGQVEVVRAEAFLEQGLYGK